VPGVVSIYAVGKGGQLLEQDGPEIAAIAERLSDRTIRPLTDNVYVYAALAVEIDFSFRWFITQNQANNFEQIQRQVQEAVAAYEEWQTAVMNRDINPDRLIQLCRSAGAKRIEIQDAVDSEGEAIEGQPSLEFTSMQNTQMVVKFLDNPNRIQFAGIEGE